MSLTKGLRSAAAFLLAAIMVFSFPVSAMAVTTSYSKYTGKTYTHNAKFDGYDRHNGIDVSSHNGDVNWQSVKKDGIEYAVIRAGFTGYTKSKHSINADPKAAENIEGAKEAGLPVGVYWFSQALNESEARAEAQKTLEILGDYNLELPVFYDYEFYGVPDGRLDSAWANKTITKAQMTANVRAFCEVIENAGYEAAVYANKSFLTDQIDGAALSKDYKVWLAHFTTKTDYSGDYYMWQYTESGKVNGISGDVDCDFMYLPKGVEVGTAVRNFNVYARGNGGKDLYLEWDEVHGADRYEIYTVSQGKEYLNGESSESKYKFTNLTPTWEYDVKVKAYNQDDELVAESGIYRICAGNAPVENIKLTRNSSSSVKVSWDATSGHGYIIQWSKSKDFSSSAGTATISGSGTTSYTLNIANAKDYYVRVRAYKNFNGGTVVGDFSEGVKLDQALSAPTWYDVYARGNGGKSLYLDWNTISNADGYKVYIVSGDKEYLKGDVKESKFTFTDFTPSWEYTVKVVAYNKYSSASSKTTVGAAPAAPTGLDVEMNGNTIKATWDVASCHGYYIQWATDESFKNVVGGEYINGSGSTSYTIKADTTQSYYVRVRTWKNYQGSKLYSDFSAPVKSGAKPSAPTWYNVYARGNGGKALYLDWNTISNADGYKVYIVSGDKEYLKGDVKESKFTFTDFTPSWEYTVKVVAYNDYGSSSSTTTVGAAPAAPTGLEATSSGSTIKATWDVASCHGYYIQWATDESFKNVAGGEYVNGSGSTSYTIKNISSSKTYYVRVRTWKNYQGSKLYSDFSAPEKSIAKPSAPTGYNVYARGNGGKSLYLEWNADANAEGYKVYIVSGDKEYLKGDVKESKFTFTDLTPSWEYNVKVVAYNDYGTASSTTTVGAAPAAPTGLEVEASGNTIKANWDVASCHGYYIQWATDKDFKNVVGGEFVNGSGSTNYTINVDGSKTYYVRVRTWKNYQGSKLYSDFSAPENVTVK